MDTHLLKETAPFVQFSSVKVTDDFNPLFDIEKIPKQSLEDYCQQLLKLSFSIPHSEIPAFICHHCNLVKEPLLWLNKFEKLLTVNDELFSGTRKQSRLMKFYACIETKRNKILEEAEKTEKKKPAKKYINAESEERYFSFHELKTELAKLSTDAERIMLLTKEKFEYQQSCIETININTLAYDEQCEKEIQQIYAMRKLQEEMGKMFSPSTPETSAKEKINLHGPINIITNAFKQMMTSVKPNGKPYIQKRIKDIAEFISENFADENGNPLSKETLQTYLSPGRNDKDPNSDMQINF
ncbi:Uncharacterised protein [Chryseobacterium taklimakanense]|uniref:Uncharacterized protein n=1 Tax=Chryseobacterium taklimakanense TaxID=536441 RepID=A0A239WCV0_9FLAO|nr:hypothetical protein [Chryseobacterium taklimakanense]SNV31906.1 Uncharacterised protein [Chryseobacterium taklimakanense]